MTKPPKEKPTEADSLEDKPLDKIIVGPLVLAAALNITDRRVHQLVKGDVFETDGGRKGKYDMVKCVRAYIQFLLESYKRPEAVINIQSEELRGKQLDNDQKEIDLAEARRELVPILLFAEILDQLVTTMKAVIVAKQNIIRSTDPAKAAKKTDDCFREILLELSGLDADTLLAQAKAEIVRAPGTNNGKPMGRQTPKIKP